MKIVWTRRANRHLRSAYEYWAHEKSIDAAEMMLDRIFAAVELLPNHPEIGREGRVPGTRELVLRPAPFLIAYRVHRQRIAIIALLHGARKWPANF
ncbi:MAG TPA: type II toxin-antitoxin system RelE/ParE family toxin [Candidatus Sulfotelmatobacter sp.]|jgi:addiction module RelE/StbE family toxin